MTTPRSGHASRHRRDQPPPGTGPSEKEVLLGFLAYLRSSVISKLEGVPEPQVRAPGVPSGTNLLGLVKHLTHVERFIFLGEDVDHWPATFHPGPDDTIESVVTAYRDATERADRAVHAAADLDVPPTAPALASGRRRCDGP